MNISYNLLSVVDVFDSLLHAKIIAPRRTQTALIRKASWCIYFIPPPSAKDYFEYLIRKKQPFKSCTLVSIHAPFWQTFVVVLRGCSPPSSPCLLSALLQLIQLAHSAVLIASLMLEGRQ